MSAGSALTSAVNTVLMGGNLDAAKFGGQDLNLIDHRCVRGEIRGLQTLGDPNEVFKGELAVDEDVDAIRLSPADLPGLAQRDNGRGHPSSNLDDFAPIAGEQVGRGHGLRRSPDRDSERAAVGRGPLST